MAVLAGTGLLFAAWFSWAHPKLEMVRSFQAPGVNLWADAVPAEFDGQPGKELLVTKGDEMQAYSAKGEFQGS